MAGKSKVNAVYNAEYHKLPYPEKSGAHAPNPGLYVYGAIVNNGGKHKATDTNHPAPNPANTYNNKLIMK